jgi:hypothetical protein
MKLYFALNTMKLEENVECRRRKEFWLSNNNNNRMMVIMKVVVVAGISSHLRMFQKLHKAHGNIRWEQAT